MKNAQASELHNSALVAFEATGQVMFEYNPETLGYSWSGAMGLSALVHTENQKDSHTKEEFECLICGEDAEERAEQIIRARDSGESYTIEYRLVDEEGEKWVEERGSWIKFGNQERLVGVLRPIDEQKAKESRLALLAVYDELTGLLNRQRIKELLGEHISEHIDDGGSGAYIMVGIDDLGVVNNDFGFDIADDVIVQTAERIQLAVDANLTLGRVAGTKFGLILPEADRESVRSVCTQILGAVRESLYETLKGGLTVSVCAGVAILDEDVHAADIAMARAEAALDAARQIGPSSWSSFSENTEMVTRRRRNTEMSDVILTALNERRIELAFQPIVDDLHTECKKYECLIRMHHKGEEVAPVQFIPVAERLGLVHLLDRRVLELAVVALRRQPDIELNVNVSWETVKDPVWAEGYLSQLRANRDTGDRITVELTETQMIDQMEATREFVSAIKEVGCKFALDDFGAGFTSFRNLQELDIDILKIDGSFVTGVSASRENQLFVRTLLDLARNFEMKTVAEWVDNDADAMLLKGLGVDYLQGFLIGKPLRRREWTEAEPEPMQKASSFL